MKLLYHAFIVLLVAARIWALDPTTQNSSLAYEDDESECIEWAYEPQIEFYGPSFEEASKQKHYSINQAMPEDYYAPRFEDFPEEFQALGLEPIDQYDSQFEFQGPPIVEPSKQHNSINESLPEEFYAPRFEDWPEEFHAPSFDSIGQQDSPIEFYGQVVDTPKQQQQYSVNEAMPEEFQGPPIVEPSKQQQYSTTEAMPEEFQGPPIVELSKQQHHSSNKQSYNALSDDVYAPSFEPIGQRLPVDDEYGVPSEKVTYATIRPTTRVHTKGIPFKHDAFAIGDNKKVTIDEADVPYHSAAVQDEFYAVEEELPLRKHRPSLRKKYHKEEKKAEPQVHDDFASVRDEKTYVEPVQLPPPTADVHDHFAAIEPEKKKSRKEEQETWFGKSYYDSGPITQFFLDLIGAEAPVQDGFTQGVSDKTIVEPVRDYPEPTAKVHDEFTLSDNGKKGYRSKRSTASLSGPSSDNALWKLVCLSRRPEAKPASRVLTSADFVEFAHDANDKIQRCIGKHDGEEVAAGLCRKFYLHCTPMINIRMCSQADEVFSEAHKRCMGKDELKECQGASTVHAQQISLSSKPTQDERVVDSETLLGLANGKTVDFCVGKTDGFYRDSKNCSRILQCFDDELFEYEPCKDPMAFDVKRGLCEYREKVASCIN